MASQPCPKISTTAELVEFSPILGDTNLERLPSALLMSAETSPSGSCTVEGGGAQALPKTAWLVARGSMPLELFYIVPAAPVLARKYAIHPHCQLVIDSFINALKLLDYIDRLL
jgi:hypothetical protein